MNTYYFENGVKIKQLIKDDILKLLKERVDFYNDKSDEDDSDKYDIALYIYYKNAYDIIKSLEAE